MTSYIKQLYMQVIFVGLGFLLYGLIPCEVRAEKTADFTYVIQEEEEPTVSIKKYIGKSSTVTVPNTISGYPVVEINKGAFAATGVGKVLIGDNVEIIEESAFRDCKKLETVNFGEKVKEIRDFAFLGCEALEDLNFNQNLQSIGQMAFSNCTGLTTVQLPNNIRALYTKDEGKTYGGVFYNCDSLKQISLGERMTEIPMNTFSNCSSLTMVKMPNTIETIGTSAFAYCSKLQSIELPQCLTTIETGAFFNCTELQVLSFPDSLTTIENNGENNAGNTFGYCENLGKVVFGEQLKSIPSNCFAGNSKITSIVFYGETSIETDAFLGCNGITNVYYLKNVPKLSEDAFGTNERLTIRYPFGNKRGSTEHRYSLFDPDDACVTAIFQTPDETISKKVVSGMPVNKPIISEKNGYRLSGWTYSNNDARTSWDFSKSVFINFYFESQWKAGTYTLSFDATEGTLDTKEQEREVLYGKEVGALPTPSRMDYDFAGWYTKKNKAGKKYTKTTEMSGTDMILYAGWNLNPTAPDMPVLTLSEEGANKIKILWKKNSAVTGYTIYCATSKNGKFTKIGTASGAATGYVNGGLKPGKNYYYRVRSYKLLDGQKINSAFSDKEKIYLSGKPDRPTFTAKKRSATSTDLSWEKFTDAEYVDVYYSTSRSGKYNKFATYTGISIGCYHTKLKKNKTYYYKIRTHNVVKNEKVYSEYSTVEKVTLK